MSIPKNFQLTWLFVILLFTACQPIRPEAVATRVRCTDQDKIDAYMQNATGFNTSDLELAMQPFADNAVWRLDAPPIFDETTQEYKVDPKEESTMTGRAAISETTAAIIKVAVKVAVISDTIQVNGQTLTLKYIASSPIYGELGYPSNEIESQDTSEFNDDCKIITMHSVYTAAGLKKWSDEKKAKTP